MSIILALGKWYFPYCNFSLPNFILRLAFIEVIISTHHIDHVFDWCVEKIKIEEENKTK